MRTSVWLEYVHMTILCMRSGQDRRGVKYFFCTSPSSSPATAQTNALSARQSSSTGISPSPSPASTYTTSPCPTISNWLAYKSADADHVTIALYYKVNVNQYVSVSEAAQLCGSVGWNLGQLATAARLYVASGMIDDTSGCTYI